MHKKTTLRDLKVLLLKTVLPVLVLTSAFYVTSAQNVVTPPKKDGKRIQNSAVTFTPGMTKEQVRAAMPNRSTVSGVATDAAMPSDNPVLNKQFAEKLAAMAKAPQSQSFQGPQIENSTSAVCTFTGALLAGDNSMPARLFRPGTPGGTCAVPQPFPGTFSAGQYFYDTYTMQNLTCASQCVTVTLTTNDGTNANIQAGAWLGTFNPANMATNYIADPYVSTGTPAPPAGLTFSFNLAANATAVFVVWSANPNSAASGTANDYTLTVTGLTCTPPPACIPIGPSVLSQALLPPVPTTVFNQGFDVAAPLPAGWASQNLSSPLGVTGWFQGNAGVFAANSGAATSYIAANFNNGSGLATISNWLFMPATTLKNGDTLSFYTRTTTGTFPDRLQVWMNTTNQGVNVGATATSVGDYSTQLLDINPTYTATGYPTGWTQFKIPITGLPGAGVAGRLAFRYFVENGGPSGANSDFIGIDDVVYRTLSPGPPPTTCTGSTANLIVDIQGGIPGDTYNLVINANPGGNFNVNNYTSGNYIPVTPTANTTYSLVSVTSASNPCCVGTGNSGTPTITVLPTTVNGLTITENPTGPLCAGDPKLLTVLGPPTLGSVTQSSGAIAVAIPDASATGASHTIAIAGIPATAVGTGASVNFNITHTWDSDLSLFLRAPNNQVLNLVNRRGGSGDNFVNTTINSTSTNLLSAAAAPFTGTYAPDGALGAPAPTGYTVTATTFAPLYNTTALNGNWTFAARDNAGGDVGTITSWSLTLNYSVPAGPPAGWTFLWTPAAGLSSTTSNPVAASPSSTRTYTVLGTAPNGCNTSAAVTITVYQLPAVVTQPSNTTVCAGAQATFTVGGTGQGITYQWQVSTNGGGTYTNIANGAPYSGATTATLTINPTTVAMNGYRYRCVISGTCPPAANSVGAILTVNALPNVTISPASPVCGGVAGINGTALTASGANTYIWSPNTGLYTNATATAAYTGTNLATVYAAPAVNTVYTVNGTNTTTGCSNTATVNVVYTPPVPAVNPTNVAMCLGQNAVQLCITSSLAPSPFTSSYSSGAISVAVPDNTPAGGNHTINVPLPSTAQITNTRVTVNMSHTWAGDVAMVLRAPNNQIINLSFFLSATGAGPSTGFTNTTFTSDNTAPAIGTGTSPYTGTWRADRVVTGTPAAGPTGFLPTTNNWANLYSTPNGPWTLAAYDAFAGDAGTITSWSIAFDYLYGPPASGVWSPAAGLFRDAAATIPYVAGDTANCVWARPTPSGVYPYQVTVQSVGFDAFQTFSNPAPITIPSSGNGSLYPSPIVVTGLPTSGAVVENVVIAGLSHTWSNDVDVLLQSPTGVNVILMSDVGGAGAPTNVTYTFQDNGAAMNTGAANPTGTYRPTNFADGLGADNWPAPGPGVFAQANPTLSLFPSTDNANGTWRLMVVDDAAGDQGQIAGGWSIRFKYPTPGCTSAPRTVTVTVNQPTSIATQPVNQVVCTDKVATYSVVAAGSGPFSYQWQVSTNTGNTWTNVANGGVYAGATSATLTITAPPVSMSGYFYRCVVTGAAPCASVTSFQVTLTVNPLPTIVIAAAPYTRLMPGMRTTLTSTVSPAAAQTYTWLRDGAAVAGATTGILNVDVDALGVYSLRVTDVNGCTNTSNQVAILDSASSRCFIYPNPTSGQFQVRYYSVRNNVLPRSVTVYNANGDRVLTQFYTIGRPYDRMDVDLRKHGKGVYWVEVGDMNGNRLTMCRVIVQ